jgi:hypothetical protein
MFSMVDRSEPVTLRGAGIGALLALLPSLGNILGLMNQGNQLAEQKL